MNEELFVIDLTGCTNTGEIITNVSTVFEIPGAQERKISLKLNDIALNQSQFISIQSLIASYGSQLECVETPNNATAQVCQNMGIEAKIIENLPLNEAQSPSFDIPQAQEFGGNSEFGGNGSFELGGNNEFGGNGEFANAPEFGGNNEFSPTQEFGGNSEFGGNGKFEFSGNGEFGGNNEFGGNGSQEEFEQFKPIDFEYDEEKQVMDTYKKAYGEDEEDKETWEEVDYYAPATDEPVVVDSKQTIYVTQTLRSGQILEFDGNVVIIGDCHPGSEIKATGDITVWGVLGSIAHAGIKGNRDAKIRALKMNAVQLRIANCYSRRPDGTNIPYIIKSSTFTPEEARIVDDSIVLFKIID